MASIFPRNGFAPGINNTGVPLNIPPLNGCDALYYSETCAQKIDPIAHNMMIAELVTLFNACPDLMWDCTRTDNVLNAIRCLIPGSFETPVEGWSKVIFNYTGVDQAFVIPACATRLRISQWGAGGWHGAADNASLNNGGPGGFVSGEWDLTAGTVINGVTLAAGVALSIMVGRYGSTSGSVYGFSGVPLADTCNGSPSGGGGGLAGVFIGAGAIATTDFIRALAIAGAGGGGVGNTSGSCPGDMRGGSGGAPGSGANANMTGSNGVSALVGGGSGGGGYKGGSIKAGTSAWAGYGGSNFINTAAVNQQNLYSAEGTVLPPNSTSIDNGGAGRGSKYTANGTSARVVIEVNC